MKNLIKTRLVSGFSGQENSSVMVDVLVTGHVSQAALFTSVLDSLSDKKDARIAALESALVDLMADAEAMDSRLLAGQPNPGCEKGSIARAKAILAN